MPLSPRSVSSGDSSSRCWAAGATDRASPRPPGLRWGSCSRSRACWRASPSSRRSWCATRHTRSCSGASRPRWSLSRRTRTPSSGPACEPRFAGTAHSRSPTRRSSSSAPCRWPPYGGCPAPSRAWRWRADSRCCSPPPGWSSSRRSASPRSDGCWASVSRSPPRCSSPRCSTPPTAGWWPRWAAPRCWGTTPSPRRWPM